jgi:predicted amidohydrolase YtcJ
LPKTSGIRGAPWLPLLLALACGDSGAPAPEDTADVIYQGGPILTMNRAAPAAEALALKDGRILAVGSAAEIALHRGDGTRERDLGGHTLLPGFIDSHSHLFQTAMKLATVPLDPPPAGDIRSIADIQAALSKELAANPRGPDDWLIGWGYDNAMLSDGRHPTKEDLDAVSSSVPIFLLHFSIHQSVLNSRALAISGIDSGSVAPPGGVIQRMPHNRDPNGILEEKAHVPVLMRVFRSMMAGDQGPLEAKRRLETAIARYVSQGYTTISELGADPGMVAQLRQLAQLRTFPVDVVAFLIYLAAPPEEAAAEYAPDYTSHFRVGGGKINLDGGSPGRTAYLREPYHVQLEGEQDYRGYPSIADPEELNALVASYYALNVPLVLHALGDAAVDQAIAAVREAEAAHPLGPESQRGRRTQLIHLQQGQEDQFDALAELDVTLGFQVAHNFYFGDFHREFIYGPERTERLNPTRSGWDRGLSVSLHHDSPVHPVDPFMLLWAAVNRVTRSGQVIGPEQKLTVMEALEASTIEAARQFFEEDRKGSLEVGKLADLVVLDRNPLAVDPMELEDLRVLETIKEGRSVYRAEDR